MGPELLNTTSRKQRYLAPPYCAPAPPYEQSDTQQHAGAVLGCGTIRRKGRAWVGGVAAGVLRCSGAPMRRYIGSTITLGSKCKSPHRRSCAAGQVAWARALLPGARLWRVRATSEQWPAALLPAVRDARTWCEWV